jgi:hypothetical protein
MSQSQSQLFLAHGQKMLLTILGLMQRRFCRFDGIQKLSRRKGMNAKGEKKKRSKNTRKRRLGKT